MWNSQHWTEGCPWVTLKWSCRLMYYYRSHIIILVNGHYFPQYCTSALNGYSLSGPLAVNCRDGCKKIKIPVHHYMFLPYSAAPFQYHQSNPYANSLICYLVIRRLMWTSIDTIEACECRNGWLSLVQPKWLIRMNYDITNIHFMCYIWPYSRCLAEMPTNSIKKNLPIFYYM